MTTFKTGDRIKSNRSEPTYGTVKGEMATVGDPAYTQNGRFLNVIWDDKPSKPGSRRSNGGFYPESFDLVPTPEKRGNFTIGDKVTPADKEPTSHGFFGPGDIAEVVKFRDNSDQFEIRWIENQFNNNGKVHCYSSRRFRLFDEGSGVKALVDTAVREVLESKISLDTLADDLVESVLQTLNANFNLK